MCMASLVKTLIFAVVSAVATAAAQEALKRL